MLHVNLNGVLNIILYPGRLSSIDTKYHIWKMGVVLTDNVSFLKDCNE